MKRLNDEEAIKRLKEARSTIQPYQYVNEAIDYAIQALEQQASEKEHKVDVTYICDGKKCPECSKLCRHTTDISHAKKLQACNVYRWKNDTQL